MSTRRRRHDLLATPRQILAILEQLLAKLIANQGSLPISPTILQANNYRKLVQLLQQASNSLRGKVSTTRASREAALFPVLVRYLEDILQSVSQGRLSFRTFVDNNLRVLSCPEDVQQGLETGALTLFEALQLKRISATSLATDAATAANQRQQLCQQRQHHRWTVHQLRQAVDELLANSPMVTSTSSPRQNNSVAIDKVIDPDAASTAIIIDPPPTLELIAGLPENAQFVSEQLHLINHLLATLPQDIPTATLENILSYTDKIILDLQQLSFARPTTTELIPPPNDYFSV
jgi:hypothetical protein